MSRAMRLPAETTELVIESLLSYIRILEDSVMESNKARLGLEKEVNRLADQSTGLLLQADQLKADNARFQNELAEKQNRIDALLNADRGHYVKLANKVYEKELQ